MKKAVLWGMSLRHSLFQVMLQGFDKNKNKPTDGYRKHWDNVQPTLCIQSNVFKFFV